MFLKLIFLGLSLYLLAIANAYSESMPTISNTCGYYLAESKVKGFGRGVFTGQALNENQTMFESSTVLVRNALAMETMLAYYVFTDDNDDYEVRNVDQECCCCDVNKVERFLFLYTLRMKRYFCRPYSGCRACELF